MNKQNNTLTKRPKQGIVYLVGAGPGDPGLISVKGNELLHTCDIVIYDALVNETLVATLPDTTTKIFAGKRGNKLSASQSDINKMLLTYAKKGKVVVRLKGGDPLLFGRGSEEMEYLSEHRINFEVVPGVSSAIAAPAWAGIPVTHRSISRSVAIVTGHLQAGESIDNLTMPVADTIVFLMAMQNLPVLVDRILSGAKFTKKTPAAIVQNGTLPYQKVVSGTLGTIVSLKERHSIEAPAVFVVGETAKFAKSLSWFRASPLAGTRVIVLRTPEQSDDLLKELYSAGATAVPWPIIKIQPRTRTLASLSGSFLAKFTMVIFTSPNGVRLFMEALFHKGIDARHLAGKKIYTIGGGTAASLKKYGIIPDYVPKKFVAEELLSIIPEHLQEEHILVPRASVARTILIDTLKARHADVTEFQVYDTVATNPEYCPVLDGDYVLFTSSSTVEHYFENPLCRDYAIIPCCIGDITASTVRKYFKGSIFTAENASIPAMVDTIKEAVKTSKRNTRI
jgi:uroporphyrinogen III methyltransferase/synthase